MSLGDDVWMLVFDPDLTMPQRAETSCVLWDRHGPAAVIAAAGLSADLVARVAASPARSHFEPAPPDLSRLFGLPDDDAAFRAWQLVGGHVLNELDGLSDPAVPQDVTDLARDCEHVAVFVCAWWAIRAVSTLAQHDRANFSSTVKAAHDAWQSWTATPV